MCSWLTNVDLILYFTTSHHHRDDDSHQTPISLHSATSVFLGERCTILDFPVDFMRLDLYISFLHFDGFYLKGIGCSFFFSTFWSRKDTVDCLTGLSKLDSEFFSEFYGIRHLYFLFNIFDRTALLLILDLFSSRNLLQYMIWTLAFTVLPIPIFRAFTVRPMLVFRAFTVRPILVFREVRMFFSFIAKIEN